MKKKDHSEKNKVVPFANTFNHISTSDLEEIMEWLGDNGYLSDTGKTFKSRFWDLFIKKTLCLKIYTSIQKQTL